MSKSDFHLLLSRYQQGICTEQEKRIVEQWLQQLGGEYPSQSEAERAGLEERMWAAIRAETLARQPRPFYRQWYAAAAAVLVVLGLGWLTFNLQGPASVVAEANHEKPGFITQTNTTGEVLTVSLPDGSEVSLAPHSSLSYPEDFRGATRDVYLKGRAFFDVSSNAEKPFLVYSGEIVTRVVGTSFWVSEKSGNKEIEVSVVSGKVSVSTQEASPSAERKKKGVLLTANQKATYSEKSRVFETGLVEDPVPVTREGAADTPPLPDFHYKNALVADVLADLRRTYGIEITVENEQIGQCTFHGDIAQHSLYTKLNLLCSSVNATFEIHGTHILISGKGCSPK